MNFTEVQIYAKSSKLPGVGALWLLRVGSVPHLLTRLCRCDLFHMMFWWCSMYELLSAYVGSMDEQIRPN
jgi:hypothetical protein